METTGKTVHLRLTEDASTLAVWPHPFQADLTITLGGPSLTLTLAITNTGAAPFTFTGALHTYLRVADVHNVRLTGLAGTAYEDSVRGGRKAVQDESALAFGTEIDRIYFHAGSVAVEETGRRMRVAADGFPDVVVWNPGPDLGAKLADLEPDGYRHMLCVEAAVIGQPVMLEPGTAWQGSQTLTTQNQSFTT